ncbi:MAG: hypothetical protein AVDCRST_MAG20-1808, partial [uncultured Acidimicrobiales bacterium]
WGCCGWPPRPASRRRSGSRPASRRTRRRRRSSSPSSPTRARAATPDQAPLPDRGRAPGGPAAAAP